MSCACASASKNRIELVDIIKHTDEIYSFKFTSQEIDQWQEGDSSKLFLKVGDQEIGKKFSYASLPSESQIRFTTRIKANRSEYKDYLSRLEVGNVLEITAPSGNFKLLRHNRPLLMLSNGVGIAAIRSLIKAYSNDDYGIPELVQLNVDADGNIYKDEFEAMNFNLSTFVSLYTLNRKSFYQTMDSELQRLLMKYVDTPYIYVVGSDNFVEDVIIYLKEMGILDEDIITDGHRHNGGSCGCSEHEGCGCGSNLIKTLVSL